MGNGYSLKILYARLIDPRTCEFQAQVFGESTTQIYAKLTYILDNFTHSGIKSELGEGFFTISPQMKDREIKTFSFRLNKSPVANIKLNLYVQNNEEGKTNANNEVQFYA